jgi:hypothetical protein
MITRREVADRIEKYLRNQVSLDALVEWAENAIIEGERVPVLRDVIARLGLIDVREFGLTVEDCRSLLESIGYHMEVQLTDLRAS